MKNLIKRSLALLLVLAMCISMTVMASAAVVEYITGNPTPVSSNDDAYTNVIANWGTRGVTADFLSPNAVKAYGTNNEFYQESAELYERGGDLYKSLQSYMKNRHKTITDYQDTRALYAYTDCQNNAVGSISSFYSGTAIGPEWDSGKTWNREHTWPNSKGLAGDDENDIMMLRPTAKSENGSRSNKAYGQSSGYYDPNAASGYKYDVRGDVARIVLYVYVRWGNTNLYGKSGVIESEEILLSWNAIDPVDTWEMGRNDSVESITGVRNVFVDYPELAYMLFDEEIPQMVTPSGMAGEGAYDVTVSVDDANAGQAIYDADAGTITAIPAEGYRVSGYTLTSGTADVSQAGNVFTISPSSDCAVVIHFKAKETLVKLEDETGGVVTFETVEEALDNAVSGDTVTLMADAVENVHLTINEGVTLDLAGYDLTAKSLTGLNGSYLNATRYGNEGHGRLFVAKNRLSLSSQAPTYIPNGQNYENHIIPYWDPADGCYVLANTRIKNIDGALQIDQEAKTISFKFSYGAGGAANADFLSDGAEDNALTFVVRLEWESENGIAYQDFVYKNEYVSALANSGGNFTFELTGYDALSIDLSTFSITGMILSDSGIIVSGQEYTA